jgi:hypothetical protein
MTNAAAKKNIVTAYLLRHYPIPDVFQGEVNA